MAEKDSIIPNIRPAEETSGSGRIHELARIAEQGSPKEKEVAAVRGARLSNPDAIPGRVSREPAPRDETLPPNPEKIEPEPRKAEAAPAPRKKATSDAEGLTVVASLPAGGERRAHERDVFSVDAILTTRTGRRIKGQTVNVSVTGMLVSVPQKHRDSVAADSTCRVRLNRDGFRVECEARVLRLVEEDGSPTIGLALQITMITREEQARLVQLMAAAQTPAPFNYRKYGMIAGVAIGALVAAVGIRILLQPPPPVPAQVALATRGEVFESVNADGEIIADQRLTLRSPLDEPRIFNIDIKRGDRVKAGDVLARFEDPNARPTGGNAAVGAAEARLRAATDRLAQLRLKGGDHQDFVDAEAAVKAAREGVAVAQSYGQNRGGDSKRTTIVAPFDALVADVQITSGELVKPQAVLFELLNDKKLHVRAAFTEADAAKLRAGMKSFVNVAGIVDPIPATVEHVSTFVQIEAGRRAVIVTISLPSDPAFKPGASAKSQVILSTRPEALLVPQAAVTRHGDRGTVFVVGPGNRLDQRSVKLGVTKGDLVEVVDGIGPADSVAIASPGQPIGPGVVIAPHE